MTTTQNPLVNVRPHDLSAPSTQAPLEASSNPVTIQPLLLAKAEQAPWLSRLWRKNGVSTRLHRLHHVVRGTRLKGASSQVQAKAIFTDAIAFLRNHKTFTEADRQKYFLLLTRTMMHAAERSLDAPTFDARTLAVNGTDLYDRDVMQLVSVLRAQNGLPPPKSTKLTPEDLSLLADPKNYTDALRVVRARERKALQFLSDSLSDPRMSTVEALGVGHLLLDDGFEIRAFGGNEHEAEASSSYTNAKGAPRRQLAFFLRNIEDNTLVAVMNTGEAWLVRGQGGQFFNYRFRNGLYESILGNEERAYLSDVGYGSFARDAHQSRGDNAFDSVVAANNVLPLLSLGAKPIAKLRHRALSVQAPTSGFIHGRQSADGSLQVTYNHDGRVGVLGLEPPRPPGTGSRAVKSRQNVVAYEGRRFTVEPEGQNIRIQHRYRFPSPATNPRSKIGNLPQTVVVDTNTAAQISTPHPGAKILNLGNKARQALPGPSDQRPPVDRFIYEQAAAGLAIKPGVYQVDGRYEVTLDERGVMGVSSQPVKPTSRFIWQRDLPVDYVPPSQVGSLVVRNAVEDGYQRVTPEQLMGGIEADAKKSLTDPLALAQQRLDALLSDPAIADDAARLAQEMAPPSWFHQVDFEGNDRIHIEGVLRAVDEFAEPLVRTRGIHVRHWNGFGACCDGFYTIRLTNDSKSAATVAHEYGHLILRQYLKSKPLLQQWKQLQDVYQDGVKEMPRDLIAQYIEHYGLTQDEFDRAPPSMNDMFQQLGYAPESYNKIREAMTSGKIPSDYKHNFGFTYEELFADVVSMLLKESGSATLDELSPQAPTEYLEFRDGTRDWTFNDVPERAGVHTDYVATAPLRSYVWKELYEKRKLDKTTILRLLADSVAEEMEANLWLGKTYTSSKNVAEELMTRLKRNVAAYTMEEQAALGEVASE